MKLIDYIKKYYKDVEEFIDSVSMGYRIRRGNENGILNHSNISYSQARILACKILCRVDIQFTTTRNGVGGFFDPNKNIIVVNLDWYLDNYDEKRAIAEVSEALAHEFTHAMQYYLNQDAFVGYIDPCNYVAYREQHVEREAYHYGELNRPIWRKLVKKLVRSSDKKVA